MPTINLSGSELDVLKRIIADENPGFSEIPNSFKFGSPIPGVKSRTSINIVGLPGKRAEALVSGIRTLQYNRIDLGILFSGQKPLNVYGCVTTRDVLAVIKHHWGADIDPNFVIDEPLVEGTSDVTLNYQQHERVLMGNSVTLPVSWADTIDISLVYKDKVLDGFVLPWPYLQNVADIFTIKTLDGFTYPELSLDLGVMSEHWTVDDPQMISWMFTRTANGPYAKQSMVDLFKALAPALPWKFVDSEIETYNLWGSTIVSNSASSAIPGYTHVIKIRVNTTYFHNGSGIVTVHYKQ